MRCVFLQTNVFYDIIYTLLKINGDRVMKKKLAVLALTGAMMCSLTALAADVPAFPGAEGGGKYTKGARASSSPSVYHVTNLNAKGSGSFADAVSETGRVIVFDVGGTIELNGTLTIGSNNLTILGQTAPGDGITFTGGDILIKDGVSNVIMRHIRVRPTDKNGGEPDAIGGRWNRNIILDHCSMSWSVDEMMTLYAGSSESRTPGSYLTVQNCIAAESLRMSNHIKGAHGYGGIVGATSSSWLNNLFAHHDSRSPRLDRELKKTDFSNNVIYNWGKTNSAYGAEPYSYNNKTQTPSVVNWVNNYYKYGPGTGYGIRGRIFDVSNSGQEPYSQFYFNGNYVEGYTEVTADNTRGINNSDYAEFLTEEVDMGNYAYEENSAEEAYEYVLENAGATLPKRDAIDARIVNDVKNRTGRIINNANETGGIIETEKTERVFEIPQEWISEHGFDGYKETSVISDGEFAGYMLIEAYVNDWTQQQEAPSNPMITVLSPATAAMDDEINGYSVDNGNWAVINEDETVTYHAVADAVNGVEVTKMELYDSNKLIATYDGAEINDSISLATGEHYLSCRAYNEKGEATQSTVSIVYVKSVGDAGSFEFVNIGDGAFEDKGSAWLDYKTGVYTVTGSGKITSAYEDSCGFMYKAVDGDFDITVKIDDLPKYENGQISGLMARTSLEPNAVMGMVADGWLKYGENVRVVSRMSESENTKETYFKDSSGKTLSNGSSYDSSASEYILPQYMRIQREGNTLTFSVSNSGSVWTDNPRQPMSIEYSELPETMYIGIAVDSVQGTPVKEYFTMAGYSKLTVNGETDVEIGLRAVEEKTGWIFDDYYGAIAGETFVGDYMRVLGNSKMTVDGSAKTIEGVSYVSRLKLGGGASFDENGIPVSGAVEILPAADGIVNVAFTHASSKGDTRYMAVMQNGEEISVLGVEPGEAGYLTCDVSGGNSVYIYSKGSGLNIFGIYYTPTGEPVEIPTPTPKPTATPKPEETATPEPTATLKPEETATPEPTATPKPEETATPEPTATPKPEETTTPEPTATPKPEETATPEPQTFVTEENGKVKVKAEKNGTVYIAGYENGKLVSLVISDIEAWNVNEYEIPSEEIVKVMVWDESSKPQCEVYVINKL